MIVKHLYIDLGNESSLNKKLMTLSFSISPLEMIVKTKSNSIKKSIAINEISILRQSRQTASISILNGSKKLHWSFESLGILMPHTFKTDCTRPEQSNPNEVFPPHL